MKICVIGTGYVGLTGGACLAEIGHEVICVDIDKEKINKLRKGIVPFYDPGLDNYVNRNVANRRLKFTTNLKKAVQNSRVCFISVGTPPCEDGSCDLQHVLDVAESIGKAMNGYKVIVNKSTVPVGTARQVATIIKKHTRHPFDVVSNPEFLKEGMAVNDFMQPDRIIIGSTSHKAIEIMEEVYRYFIDKGFPLIKMDPASAEMTKYAANSMLATRISFMNDLANLCDKVGASINSVQKGIGSDRRIGDKFLSAGIGYGGSCFPKDIKAIIKTAGQHGQTLRILQAVEDVNNDQKKILFEKINNYFDCQLEDKKIAIWGLAFKPHTDDIRESPATNLINSLLQSKSKITVCDPQAMPNTKKMFGGQIDYQKDQYLALQDADALAIITEWDEYKQPDFVKMKKLMKNAVIFDGRNIYQPRKIKRMGFEYFGIGRG